MVVASCIDGRVRVRDSRLRSEEVAAAVRDALRELPGIITIAVSDRVGSLLVTFEAGMAKAEAILATLRDLLGGEEGESYSGPARPVSPKQMAERRRSKTRAMLGVLLAMVAAAVIDMEKLHVGAGFLFLSFLANHLYERWGALFPKAPRPVHA